MINDCAFVGETIVRYLPENFEVQRILRTRGLWSKTFHLLWKILRAKADVFHVHYVLQDAYLTLKLKREPVIVHAHGTDLRTTIHSKWGWLVRYSVKHAKRLLVSPPDILGKARKLRPDAIYVPNPVDLKEFALQPLEEHEKTRLLHPYASNIRGTEKVFHAFSLLEKRYPNEFELVAIDGGNYSRQLIQDLKLKNVVLFKRVPHERMVELYRGADVVITDMGIGAMSNTSIEGIACGRPVVQYVKKGVYNGEIPLPPVFKVDEPSAFELYQVLSGLRNVDIYDWRSAARQYVELHHDAKMIARRVAEVYMTLG